MIKARKESKRDLEILDFIKNRISDKTNIPDLFIKSRKSKYTDARCVFYELAYEFTDLTLCQIGKYSGKINHSAVMNGRKNFKYFYGGNSFLYNLEYRSTYEDIKEKYGIKIAV